MLLHYNAGAGSEWTTGSSMNSLLKHHSAALLTVTSRDGHCCRNAANKLRVIAVVLLIKSQN